MGEGRRFALAAWSAYIVAMSSLRPWRTIERRQSRQIMVGNVAVGGDAPVTVQTMTNTPTSDANATIAQTQGLRGVFFALGRPRVCGGRHAS
jgi:hypothetical protein